MVQNRGDAPPRSPRLERPKAQRKNDQNPDGLFGNLIADEAPYTRSTLLRLGGWGFTATAGLVLAIAISQSPFAERRNSLASTSDLARQSQRIQFVADSAANENRRLLSATETLQSDRDRLYARVTNLEQTLTALQSAGAVASLAQDPKSDNKSAAKQDNIPVASVETIAPAQVAQAKPAPANSAKADPTAVQTKQVAAALSADPVITGSIDRAAKIETNKPETKAAPELSADAAAETPVPRTEFGVDLGTASSIQGLRALWSGMKQSNNALLGSLRPIVAIKERNNGLGMQLRLVAGPLTDAAAAAKLCATLAIRNNECDTTVYDGQRLSVQSEGKSETKNAALSDTSGEKPQAQKADAAPAKRVVKRRAVTTVRRQPSSAFGFR
jgi:hypothetical protein